MKPRSVATPAVTEGASCRSPPGGTGRRARAWLSQRRRRAHARVRPSLEVTMATLRLLALPLLAALALPAAAGDLKGVVHYAGTPPKNPPYAATRDQKVCGQGVPNESVEVANGHLGNVVITLKGSGLPKPPPQTITIDQRQCRYRPHVQAAPTGSTLQILNSDPDAPQHPRLHGPADAVQPRDAHEGPEDPAAAAARRARLDQVRRPQLDAGLRGRDGRAVRGGRRGRRAT